MKSHFGAVPIQPPDGSRVVCVPLREVAGRFDGRLAGDHLREGVKPGGEPEALLRLGPAGDALNDRDRIAPPKRKRRKTVRPSARAARLAALIQFAQLGFDGIKVGKLLGRGGLLAVLHHALLVDDKCRPG